MPPPGPVFNSDSIYEHYDFSQTLFYKSPETKSKLVAINPSHSDHDIATSTQVNEPTSSFVKPFHSFSPTPKPNKVHERPRLKPIRYPKKIMRKPRPMVFGRRPRPIHLRMPLFFIRKIPFPLHF